MEPLINCTDADIDIQAHIIDLGLSPNFSIHCIGLKSLLITLFHAL